MGCLFSKKSKPIPPSNNDSISMRQISVQSEQSSVVGYAASPNAPVSTVSRSKVPGAATSNIKPVKPEDKNNFNPIHVVNSKVTTYEQPEDLANLNCVSLLICPPSEHLLKRMWIKKRGHMVRTWKKRYCVLEKNELKYYSKPDTNPPYGKNLKGHLALMGAVMNIVSSESDNTICVEIYGNLGEIDLFFELDYTIEALDWLRVLRWAIRKNTLTTLIQNLKSKGGLAEVDIKDKSHKYTSCVDWQQNELDLYKKAVTNLRSVTRVMRVLMYNKRGVRTIKPCLITLWTAHDESHEISEFTFSNTIGISWSPVHGSSSSSSGGGGNRDRSNSTKSLEGVTSSRSIALSDLDDVIAYDHCELNNGENMRWYNQDLTLSANSSKHSHCAGKPARVISFVTRFGHTLDIVGCCAHDYENSLTSFCDLNLFQAMQRKLKAAIPNARTTKEVNSTMNSAVCGACSSISHVPF